jgi:UDP-N-acetylmuramoyl-L-alanyl-D-glutamate--2,6-diaminopimelate ligase
LKTLFEILNGIPILNKIGKNDFEIAGITGDSRKVEPNFMFVAVKGTTVDGHDFIEKAIGLGATVILCENRPENLKKSDVLFLEIKETAAALSLAAANFYDNPSKKMTIIGVTGTNGKTTVTTLLWQFFTKIGFKCGLIGTVENKIGLEIIPATHTTPDAVSLQKLLARMVSEGCSHVFIEVSSHAIEQRRTAGVAFSGALFTNLTQDHLDYHGTMADYRDAKKRLFDELSADSFALVNADDRNAAMMLQNTEASKHKFGLQKMGEFKVKILENNLDGLHLLLDSEAIHCRLIGEFNASNLAAAYGTARLLGVEKFEALTIVSGLVGAEGRFERVAHPKNGTIAVIDYAHTPDALEKVLETIQKLRVSKAQKIITVVGCGGNRDKTKRPIMAEIAVKLSDQLILTSDNPRTENPETILKEMEAGISEKFANQYLIIQDRKNAIKTANQLSKPGDIILIAGKGHEKYQEINGVKHDFDDKIIIENLFNQ